MKILKEKLEELKKSTDCYEDEQAVKHLGLAVQWLKDKETRLKIERPKVVMPKTSGVEVKKGGEARPEKVKRSRKTAKKDKKDE